MLVIDNVSKRYKKKILSNFSYTFNIGNIYGIIGKSGSGKSTLLSILANQVKLYRGEIYYQDINIKNIKNYRYENVGCVFQNYQLFDELTSLENVLLHYKLNNLSTTNLDIKINYLFNYFKVSCLKNKKVKYLSGGEKQRIAIIKAIIKNPDILLLDEPTSALDQNCVNLLMEYLSSIKKDKIIIIVTHDLSLLKYFDELIDFDNLKSKKIKKVYEKKKIENTYKFNGLSTIYNKVITSKKVFSYFSNAILTFGLISISLSFVIKDFINDILDNSFSIFNTSEYNTFKVDGTNQYVDFSKEQFDNIEYIYYQGIASLDKEKIKERSIISKVTFNDYQIEDNLFVFDNYLSTHSSLFTLYVPSNIKTLESNYLNIYYDNESINVKIDEVYESNDDNFYVYCNNIYYLNKYFNYLSIDVELYSYYHSAHIDALYDKLITSYKYKNYLFYKDTQNNVIQIVKNSYFRITKDLLKEIDKEYLLSDFKHTYIDYDTGLIYLLIEQGIQVIFDDKLNDNEVGVSKAYYSNKNSIKLFNKNYKISYVSNENNYKIIYMSKNTFKSFNDLNIAYVGIIFNKDYRHEKLIINKDLFDSKSINSFAYISKFLLYLSIIIIILAYMSSTTIFSINFISKKKDIKALFNIGIYESKILYLLIKEPCLNVISSCFSSVIATLFSKYFISILYKSLSNVSLPINISITFIILICILPFIFIMPPIFIKIGRFLTNNIKK